MSEQKPMNRGWVVIGAVLIQLCLGAIYAWSVFTKPITISLEKGGQYGFTASEAAWVFSAGLATFAVVMVLAGRIMPKTGPRKLAVLGGLVLGAGYVVGGFTGSTFARQLIWIGIVGGAGIGLSYVVPIAVGIKWFPDKKGFVSGLAVAGFGFGATLWVKLAGGWGDWAGLIEQTRIFGLPGVQSTFVIYGIAFAVLVLLGSIVMKNPPEGYKPEGWEPPAPVAGKASNGVIDFTNGQMMKKPQFYGLWLMFVGSALAGLMVIYCISLFGIDALRASGAADDVDSAAKIAGTAMALYAILNGLGRIAWGMVSDKIGRRAALILMCIFQGVVMLVFYKMGASEIGLIIGACLIGFNFGGNFALFPAATADYFGNKNVGANYGWVFLAYGVAGIAGPQVAGYFRDHAAGQVTAWVTPFVIGGIACIVASLIGMVLRVPHAPAPQPETALELEADAEADGAVTPYQKAE